MAGKRKKTIPQKTRDFKINTRIIITSVLAIVIPILILAIAACIFVFTSMDRYDFTSVNTESYNVVNQIQWSQTVNNIAAVIAVCSCIQIPLAVPITLQTFAVCAAAGLLGLKNGLLTVIVYILLGLIGVPVFSNFGAGPGVLFGITGGYIVGFIFTALIVGGAVKQFGRKIGVYVFSMILGVAVCYAFGTAWFMVWSANSGSPATLGAALMSCVVPFILPDLVKIAAASVICSKLAKHIRM